MKFSTLKNEINNELNVHGVGPSLEKSNASIKEIQEKYLKNIYGGTNAPKGGVGIDINGWTAWNMHI